MSTASAARCMTCSRLRRRQGPAERHRTGRGREPPGWRPARPHRPASPRPSVSLASGNWPRLELKAACARPIGSRDHAEPGRRGGGVAEHPTRRRSCRPPRRPLRPDPDAPAAGSAVRQHPLDRRTPERPGPQRLLRLQCRRWRPAGGQVAVAGAAARPGPAQQVADRPQLRDVLPALRHSPPGGPAASPGPHRSERRRRTPTATPRARRRAPSSRRPRRLQTRLSRSAPRRSPPASTSTPR